MSEETTTIKKILQSEIDAVSIAKLRTVPGRGTTYGENALSAEQLKQRFDALPLLAVQKVNEIIDAITSGVLAKTMALEGKTLSEIIEHLATDEQIADLADSVAYIMEDLGTRAKKSDLAARFTCVMEDLDTRAKKSDLNDYARQAEISAARKRLDNLEARIAPDMFIVDDGTAYVKDIPTNVAPYAELRAIGGMTHTVPQYGTENLFDIANVKPYASYSVVVNEENRTVTFLSDALYEDLGSFSELFKGAKIGKRYYLSYNSDSELGEGAAMYSMCTCENPFTLTPEIYYSPVTFEIAYEDTPEYRRFVDTTFSDISLVEVTEALLNTKVTALDITGKNLFDEKAVTHLVDYAENISIHDPRAEEYLRVPIGTSAAAAIFNPVMYLKEGQTVCISADVYIPSGGAPSLDIYVMIHYLEENPSGSGSINSTGAYKAISAYGTWERLSVTRTAKKSGWFRLGTQAKGASVDLRVKNIKVTTDTTDTTFSPYHKTTFAIPAEVQALDGYGWGISSTLHNGIEWDDNGKPRYVKRVAKKVYTSSNFAMFSALKNHADGLYVDNHLIDAKIGNGGYGVSNKFPWGYLISAGQKGVYVSGGAIVFFVGEYATTIEEWKAQLDAWEAEGDPLTVYYELAEPIVTDVSAYFAEDNFIPVEGGGTITAVNEHGLAAPTTIVYQKRGV